jgi:hypothetical protein
LEQKIRDWKLPWEFLKRCTGAPDRVYRSLLAKTCYVLRTFSDSLPLRDARRPILLEDRIQFRICAVLWYILSKQCWLGLDCASNSGESTVHYAFDDVPIILADIVNRSGILLSSETVSAREIRDWVRKGERYHLLTVDLGGVGILFLLPGNSEYLCVSLRTSCFTLTDIVSSWFHHVPKKQETRRKSLVSSLLRRGIHRLACDIEAHQAVHGILTYCLTDLISSIASRTLGGHILLPSSETSLHKHIAPSELPCVHYFLMMLMRS